MSACDPILLSRYLDGELTLIDRRSFERHIHQCQACREDLADMRAMEALLRDWGASRVPLPPATERRVHQSLAARSRFSRILSLGRVMPAAVGTSIAALLVLTFASLIPAQSTPAQRNATGPARGVIARQSAPLQRARRISAIFGGRVAQAPYGWNSRRLGSEPD